MKQLRVFGIALTVFWLGASALFVSWKFEQIMVMGPAEWGNLLAGLIAPVTFLWLILGFVHQGQELRLQQRELRGQVAEMRALVREAERQTSAAAQVCELHYEQFEQTRRNESARIQPVFRRFHGQGGQDGVRVTFRNTGGPASHLLIRSPQTEQIQIEPSDCIPRASEGTIVMPLLPQYPADAVVEYTDEFGDRNEMLLHFHEPTSFRFVRNGAVARLSESVN
jgi:hypothetical protein